MEEESREVNPPTLQKVFGDSAVAKILDFLTLCRHFDYSMTEIARNSGVGWRTLFRVWPTLERYGLVKMTRRIGRAKMYHLNTDSPIAKTLTKLALEIASVDARTIAKEELVKEPLEVEAKGKELLQIGTSQ